MPYSIMADNLIGQVHLHRDDEDAAAKKARELAEAGMWNVRVLDDATGQEIEPHETPTAH